jgi:hypothetical protein
MPTYFAQVTYTGNGSTTSYAIPFSYIDSSHVKAYINGTITSAFTVSTSTLIFTSAPANGATVRIERQTPLDARLVDFADGSVLTEADLDRSANQNFFIAQEVADDAINNMAVDTDDKYNAQSKVIKNVANPVNANDAVNKTYLENTWLSTADKATLTNLNSNIASVNTVNSALTNINAVGSDLLEAVSEINTVAVDIVNVNLVGNAINNVNTVATANSNITTVVGQISPTNNIATVAGANTNITSVSSQISPTNNIATIAGQITPTNNIATVAGANTSIGLIGGQISPTNNIATVAGQISPTNNIQTVAQANSNITTVANANNNITLVAGQISPTNNIQTVVTAIPNITNVVSANANISLVAGQISPTNNISTVAGAISSGNLATVASAVTSGNLATVATDIAKIITTANDLNEATSEIEVVANAIANVDIVGNAIGNINIVAPVVSNGNIATIVANVSGINNFAERYRVSATAPTTSLDVGDLYFDTSTNTMKVYSSGGFINAGSSVNGTANRFRYTATASQTTFTGADANGNTLAYDAGFLDVYLNGIKLVNNSDFTASSGSSIVLAIGASASDILEVIAYGTFQLANFSIADANDVPAIGTAGQVLKVNSGATALEYGSNSITINGSVVPLGGSVTLLQSLTYSSGTATGDGSTLAFSITSGRTVNDVLVFVNGFMLTPTTDYTISGTTLTFITAPASSAEISIRYLAIAGSYSYAEFTGNGSATTITISSSRTVDDVIVVVNGLTLVPTTDYTISGTTLTFTTAPANLAEITVRYLRLS